MGVALAVLALSHAAYAQNGAACPIGAPKTITTTSYTLTNNDQCFALVFTSQNPVTLNVPAATTLAPGFQVMVLPIGNGVTVTPLLGTISNMAAIVVGPGQSGTLIGDGKTYFWASAAGFITVPAAVGSSGETTGFSWSNSPVYGLPNGISQITNPASLDYNDGDAFAVCRGGTKYKLGDPIGVYNNTNRPGPAWWSILDPLGRPFKVPLC